MTIRPEDAVARAAELISSNLEDLSGYVPLNGGGGEMMTEPLPLHTVDLTALRWSRKAASVFPQVGWRSVLTETAEGLQLADVMSDGDNLRFSRFISGGRASSMVEAAECADAAAGDGDYEIRIIESASLKIGAVWLFAARSKFVPYSSSDHTVLCETDFLKMLRQHMPTAASAYPWGVMLAASVGMAVVFALKPWRVKLAGK